MTVEQILSFAPDTGTANRGKKLANSSKWKALNKTETAIWGECKGSGSKPYLTGVDWNGPAFKCSCPVRKPPCKHVMALMLRFANSPDDFGGTPPPEWMETWLEKRAARLSKPEPTPKTDEEAKKIALKADADKQKRIEKRLENMKLGLLDLEIWLTDIVRQGLATLESQSYSFWEDAAARMVDAQVRGVSNMIKEIPLMIGGQKDWIAQVLKRLSEIYLYIQAFKNLKQLPDPIQSDILSIGGMGPKTKDLKGLNGVKDTWMVLGLREGKTIDPELTFRRVWLWGLESGQPALILDFSFRGSGFDMHWSVGTIVQTELVYFPGAVPIRAVVKQRFPSSGNLRQIFGVADFETFLGYYAKSVQANVWLMEYPCPLTEIVPVIEGNELLLIDKHQKTIPTINHGNQDAHWQLMAFSGGYPISIFGEWTGEYFIPLSAADGERFMKL